MSSNPYKSPETEGYSSARGTILSKSVVQSLRVVGILVVGGAILLPFFGRFPRFGVRESARRAACGNNLRQIALALQNYEAAYHCLPPAYTVDATGKPLHSWRTLILPFVEQKALYDLIDLSKPWDDPANRAAYETSLRIYQCPSSDTPVGHTTYLAVTTAGACFMPSGSRLLTAITDDRDFTIMVMEVADEHAVHWMSPSDIDDELLSKLSVGNSAHPSGANAAMVSGRVMFLPPDLQHERLRALISIDGNDDTIAENR